MITAIRKLSDVDEGTSSLVFNGILYPNDKVIIYDLSQGKPVIRRASRKKKENTEGVNDTGAGAVAEVPEEVSSEVHVSEVNN